MVHLSQFRELSFVSPVEVEVWMSVIVEPWHQEIGLPNGRPFHTLFLTLNYSLTYKIDISCSRVSWEKHLNKNNRLI